MLRLHLTQEEGRRGQHKPKKKKKVLFIIKAKFSTEAPNKFYLCLRWKNSVTWAHSIAKRLEKARKKGLEIGHCLG